MRADSDGALGFSNNKLNFNSANNQFRALSSFTINSTRQLALAAAAIIDTTNNTLQVDCPVTGAGALTKNGVGILNLTGANTHSGTITVNAGTFEVSGSGSLATAAGLTALTNVTLQFQDSASVPNVASYTINNGGKFNMIGTPTIKTTAPITVNAGGLFDVSGLSSPLSLGSAQTLSGSGVVTGAVVAATGSVIIPAGIATVGTLTFKNDLTLNGQTIQFDLTNNVTEGGGTNDEILVGGNLTLNGGEKILLNYIAGSLATGTYKLIKYNGTLTGTFALAAAYPNVAVDNGVGTPGYITLVVSGPAVANNLFWKGDGSGNLWDISTTANWVTNFANPALTYSDPSKVTFDDFGSNNVPVTLNSTVLPNTVTFNVTNKAYTLTGSGKISGPVGMTINGGNTLTNLLEDDNTLTTVLNNGSKLVLGNGGTTGAAGSGNITMGNTTSQVIVNRSTPLTLATITGSGGTPQVINNGSGTTTLAGGADNSFLGAVVNNGILNLGKASSGSAHALGGATTVNANGTLQLGGSGGDQIFSGVTVNLGGGTFDTAGLTEQFNILSGYGNVTGSGTISLGGYLGLNNVGTLRVSNTIVTITTGSAQWSREPGSVVFEGGTLNLPANAFAGQGAAGNQNILFNGAVTTAGNGETIFGENTESSVVTFGPNANFSVWFWSYRDTFANTFWYNGGSMALNKFNYRGSNGGAAISTHYFNGTVFTAKASTPFINAGTGSNVKFYVSTNGLIINDAGFNLSVPAILAHDPALGVALDGGLNKSGSGALTLSATNTFNGSVTINAGSLILNNAGSYNNVLFGDNTTHQINLVQVGRSLTNSSLTLGTTGGGTQNLNFNLGTLGIPTVPVLQVNNVLTNSGPVVVSLTAPVLVPGTAPLVHYGSMDAANFASTWTIAPFPYVSLTLTNDTVNKLISVIIVPGVTPKWRGDLSSVWDINTTLNWRSNGVAVTYLEPSAPGQPVTFDDTAVNFLVDISTATVNPLFINMTNGNNYTISGSLGIGGTGALIKNGAGSLVLSNASGANTYSGITTVSGGSLVAAQANVLSTASAMTLNNSSLNIGANNQALGNITLNNSPLIGSGTLSGGSLTVNNSTSQILPPLVGNLNLVQNGTGTLDMTNANTPGNIDVNAGTLRVNNLGALGAGGFTTTTATRVASGGALVFDGASGTTPEYFHFAGAGPTGAGSLVVTNGSILISGGGFVAMDADTTINIGFNASVTNTIGFNGGFALTKIGNGLLYFTGAANVNANAGTIIDAGSCSIVTVNSGGTFGGAGTASKVSVQAGGSLAPGNLGIGTLTVSDSLTNAGSVVMEISYNGSATNADRVNVSTNLILGGTLTVTNVGPNPLAAGHTFKLFNAPSYAGVAFSSVTLPTLPTGLGWTNTLVVNGSIAVIQTVSQTPFSIGTSVSGGSLTISWPGDHTGWRLQNQTNTLSTGLNPSVWFDVAGSTGTNQVTVPLDAANGSVFYRMVYP